MKADDRSVVQRPAEYAWLVTGPLVAATVLLMMPIVAQRRPVVGSVPQVLLFLALFIAAEAIILNVEVRQHTLSVTIIELPMVLALYYLAPLPLLLVRIAGSLAVTLLRRSAIPKVCFNAANRGAGTAVASMIIYAYGPMVATAPSTWLVLLTAVAAYVICISSGIVGVITLVSGGISLRRVYRMLVPSLAVAGANAVAGVIVLLVIQQSRAAVALLGIMGVVLVLMYRSYAQFLRQHKSLAEIYDLTRAIAGTRNDNTLADALLGRVRELMQAQYATLWLPGQGRYPETLLSARVDDKGLLDLSVTPEAIRELSISTKSTVAVGPKIGPPELRRALLETGTKDVIVVPLRSGDAVVGTLEAAGRLSAIGRFGDNDVRLLETVAAHAAVAVENSRLVDRLRFDAYHDGLTGLPNRRRMLAALEEAVKVRAPGEIVAVIQFDVSDLREVNDSLGHAAGDKLLAEVGRRLRRAAPPAALVGRVGGDEFVLTLRMERIEAALALAEELRLALQDPMEIGSLTLDVDTAVGIAVHPEHGSDPAALLQRAELATHAAKTVSSAVQLFHLGLESRSARRLGLAGDLRRALDNGELRVVYQPKVSLRGRQLVGVECLARWEHSVHGAVAPEDFVAVAEHTGQIGRLTDVVLREGLRHCRDWVDASRPLNVSVNLSPRTLTDPLFPDRVAELLDEFGVEPGQLTLEIVEHGVVGETDRPLPTLRRLHELGVRLAVDDFGTGYSSLSYLRRLPVDEVKIDRAFVQGMATDPGDLAIVRAVVDLSRHFGLSVVAEGVESELTLSLLEEIGCDVGQGFLFSRPLSYDRLEAWFAARTEPEATSMGEVRRLRAVP